VPASVDGGRPESTTQAATLSPGVRRIVEEEKLEPQEIAGTGLGGRLTKADAMKALEARGKAKEKIEGRESQPPADVSVGASAQAEARFIRKKMSPLRRKIAQQLVMAQHTAAILTTFNECDMSAVQELRRSKQDEFTKKHGIKLGLMSFL